MTDKHIYHKCGKDVHGKALIFYEKASNVWWMELGFDSCAVEHCPFCGQSLREGEQAAPEMTQSEQIARIKAAEVRNEMNARAIYDLQQEQMTKQPVRLVRIGNRLFNPDQITLVCLRPKSAIIEFAVLDGDQAMSTTLRNDDYQDFLVWVEGADV